VRVSKAGEARLPGTVGEARHLKRARHALECGRNEARLDSMLAGVRWRSRRVSSGCSARRLESSRIFLLEAQQALNGLVFAFGVDGVEPAPVAEHRLFHLLGDHGADLTEGPHGSGALCAAQ